jgi:hypothetical protein
MIVRNYLVGEFKMTPCKTDFSIASGITKFQALYRGYNTRKYTLLPTPPLNASICKRINDFIRSSRSNVGKDTCSITSSTNEGMRFFIKWDRNNEALSLLFPAEEAVGAGAWKRFFASNTVKILFADKKRQIKEFESVWIDARDEVVDEVRIQEFLYGRFAEERPMGVYFLEAWEKIHQSIYTQRRLINQLDGTKFDAPFQKALCIRDIARNLAWMHKQGMVHGDVSLKNILVEERVDDEGVLRLVAYLTDFGSTKPWGASQDRRLDDYVRWDPCKCFAGISTPLTDWYGFVVTNILAWFPEMTSYLKWEKFKLTRQMVFDRETRGDFVSDEVYWRDSIPYKSFSDLTSEEQQAWHLLILICRKSAQLYLYLQDRPGEISKEEVKALEIEEKCLQMASVRLDSRGCFE